MSNATDRSRRIRTEERDEALAVASASVTARGHLHRMPRSEAGLVRVELVVLLEKRRELVKYSLFQSFGKEGK